MKVKYNGGALVSTRLISNHSEVGKVNIKGDFGIKVKPNNNCKIVFNNTVVLIKRYWALIANTLVGAVDFFDDFPVNFARSWNSFLGKDEYVVEQIIMQILTLYVT